MDLVGREGRDQWTFSIVGRPVPVAADQMSIAVVSIVGPAYLTAMKIPLLRGRFFTERDDPTVPDVVVIDESFARQHFPDEDPVGKRLRIGDDPVEIIGVVGHVKMWGLDQEDRQKVSAPMYFSFRQLADSEMARASSGVVVIARTHGDRATVIQALRSTVERLGGDNVMFRVRTANEIITGYQATRRFAMYVLGAFAALALLLCTIGIYGVVSYLVARRTTEIGIRMALGATASIIMRLILRDGMKLTIAGVAIGLVAACFVTRFMTSLLFGVSALDLITFAIVAATVLAIALCALLVPARRATRLDVLQALRAE